MAKRAAKKASKRATSRGSRTATKPALKHAPRADLGAPGMVALERIPEPLRAVALAAHALIERTVPGCRSVTKWGNACYSDGDRSFAAIYATTKTVNLALPGVGLPDPEGLLEGTGKTMRHVKLRSVEDIARPALAALLREGATRALPGM